VRNTRQITKAMKMVSAAKLRRAQERAVSARPYASMLASVLESLKRRADIYDPETGEVRHPLLLTRPEKRILLVVVSGDKGFAGAFNTNIFKAAANFILENGDKEIDIEAIGRKGRDLFRRRYPAAQFAEATEEERRPERHRGSQIEVMAGQMAALEKLNYDAVREVAAEIVTSSTTSSSR
jgi:F-type H+-transporting ATPase subunit gamma